MSHHPLEGYIESHVDGFWLTMTSSEQKRKQLNFWEQFHLCRKEHRIEKKPLVETTVQTKVARPPPLTNLAIYPLCFLTAYTVTSQPQLFSRKGGGAQDQKTQTYTTGILSPMLYIIYVADLELWLKFSRNVTYTDETGSSVRAKLLADLIKMLEEDANNVLNFIASWQSNCVH